MQYSSPKQITIHKCTHALLNKCTSLLTLSEMRRRRSYSLNSILLLLVALQLFSASSSLPQAHTDKGVDTTASRSAKDEQSEVHCSRERSRASWKIIDQYLFPFLDREKYRLPSHCRLHPSNDVFRDQEEHKIHFDMNEWRCGYCKKAFFAEKYLDQHFDNRHYNLLNATHGKCLADLCGALHCDYVINSQSQKTKCNPSAAARNHHLCEELADSCFPVNTSPIVTRLHEIFLRQFCDAHNCSRGRKYFPRGGRKQTNISFLVISILVLILLPVFYTIVYLYRREMRKATQQLQRISKNRSKKKPS